MDGEQTRAAIFACTICGGRLEVRRTTQRVEYIKRERACLDCGTPFETREMFTFMIPVANPSAECLALSNQSAKIIYRAPFESESNREIT